MAVSTSISILKPNLFPAFQSPLLHKQSPHLVVSCAILASHRLQHAPPFHPANRPTAMHPSPTRAQEHGSLLLSNLLHDNAARTLVVKPRSETISALAMLRGSLSSLSSTRQQQGSGLLVRLY